MFSKVLIIISLYKGILVRKVKELTLRTFFQILVTCFITAVSAFLIRSVLINMFSFDVLDIKENPKSSFSYFFSIAMLRTIIKSLVTSLVETCELFNNFEWQNKQTMGGPPSGFAYDKSAKSRKGINKPFIFYSSGLGNNISGNTGSGNNISGNTGSGHRGSNINTRLLPKPPVNTPNKTLQDEKCLKLLDKQFHKESSLKNTQKIVNTTEPNTNNEVTRPSNNYVERVLEDPFKIESNLERLITKNIQDNATISARLASRDALLLKDKGIEKHI